MRQIEFSNDEYRLLFDMVYIAEWVMNAHETEEQEETKPYGQLEQKLLSLAKDFGSGEYVVWDEQLQKYFPTRNYEEKRPAMAFINKFEEDSFWEELIARLADRDLSRKYGEKKLKGMSFKEKLKKIGEFEEKYWDEFERNGLDRLLIDSISAIQSVGRGTLVQKQLFPCLGNPGTPKSGDTILIFN
jgi:hypothetical protein